MRGVRLGSLLLSGEVAYAVPVRTAFDYLADPGNRPEWQSSLRSVEILDHGSPRVGMRWRDHTRVGLVPLMEITALVPGDTWAETGEWRAFRALLELDFEARGGGCAVEFSFAVEARGLLRPLGWAATLAGLPAVRSDLRRAGRILEGRSS